MDFDNYPDKKKLRRFSYLRTRRGHKRGQSQRNACAQVCTSGTRADERTFTKKFMVVGYLLSVSLKIHKDRLRYLCEKVVEDSLG